MSPGILMLGTFAVVVGIVLLIVIVNQVRAEKRRVALDKIISSLDDAKYLYECDRAQREAARIFAGQRGTWWRVAPISRKREKLAEDGALYAPEKVILDACKLLNIPDDACKADIEAAADKVWDEYDPKELAKRKAPKGVIQTARTRRIEVLEAKELLLNRPKRK